MGHRQSKESRMVCLWFDKDVDSKSNLKLQLKIKSLFKSIRKKSEMKIKLRLFTNCHNYKNSVIEDKKINSALVITSGSLKTEIFDLFNSNEKVKGIIVFCFNRDNHLDSFDICEKTKLVTEKPNEILYFLNHQMEKISWISHKSSIVNNQKSISFKYNFVDNLLNDDFSLCNVYKEFTDLITCQHYYLCKNLVKKGKTDFKEESISHQINKGKLSLDNQFEEAIKFLSVEIDPLENFREFKEEIIKELNDINLLQKDCKFIYENYIELIENIQSLEEFCHKILILFTQKIYKNALYFIINDFLNKKDLLGLSKYKHLFSAIMLNFFPQYSRSANDIRKVCYQSLLIQNLEIIEFEKSFVLLGCGFNLASLEICKSNSNQKNKNSYVVNLEFCLNNGCYLMNSHLNLNCYSKLESESEIIFSPFTKFSISDVKYNNLNGEYTIKLNLIENNIYLFNFNRKFILRNLIKKSHSFVNLCMNYRKFLKKFYETKETIKIEVSLLISISKFYSLNQDYYLALCFYDKMLKIFHDYHFESIEIDYYEIAKIYEIVGKHQMALVMFCKNLQKISMNKQINSEKKEKVDTSICYFNIANSHKNSGNFKQSYDQYETATQVFSKENDNVDSWKILNFEGIIYYKFSIFEKARECFDRALKIKDSNHDINKAVLLNNIGMILFDRKEYNKALEMFEKSK